MDKIFKTLFLFLIIFLLQNPINGESEFETSSPNELGREKRGNPQPPPTPAPGRKYAYVGPQSFETDAGITLTKDTNKRRRLSSESETSESDSSASTNKKPNKKVDIKNLGKCIKKVFTKSTKKLNKALQKYKKCSRKSKKSKKCLKVLRKDLFKGTIELKKIVVCYEDINTENYGLLKTI